MSEAPIVQVDAETKELIDAFLQEAGDNLSSVAKALEGWDSTGAPGADERNDEIVKVVFRGVHSVKGAAGMFNFTELSGFAHKFESVLDRLRQRELAYEAIDIDFFKECNDQLIRLLEQSCGLALAGAEVTGTLNESDLESITQFTKLLETEAKAREEVKAEPNPIQTQDAQPDAQKATSPTPGAAKSPGPDESMRIDRRAVDKIFNLSGELLVASNNLDLFKKRIESSNTAGSSEILEAIDKVSFLSKQVQQNIMGVRMVSVKTVFQKIPRIAREISKKLNKKIELEFEGEDTQLDKAICEQLTDPLVHLLRNAMDHGLEDAEGRRSKGKSEVGKIRVSARFDSGLVLIQIQDDGRGIDPNVIFEKAVSKGLAKAEERERLTPSQCYDFLFHSGFSTAAQVSDISGRGVGLDVVRTNLTAMGGKILIESAVGKGTSFTLALPLTTGIKDSLIVGAAGELFAVPIEQVLETVKVQKDRIFLVAGKRAMHYRDEIIGVKSLSEILGLDDPSALDADLMTALVFKHGDKKLGMVVSEIASKQQVLLKPIPRSFRNNPMIQASTYLANGEAILILDPVSYINSRRISVAA